MALYGGSFDPVHNAHVAVAREVLAKLKPRTLHLIPCLIPPHKQGLHASKEQRLAMLNMAFADMQQVFIDPRELGREQISYSVTTLQEYRDSCGETTSICFVMGVDSWNRFDSWHRWQDILALANLVVVSRPGANADHAVMSKVLRHYFVANEIRAAELCKHSAGKIVMLTGLADSTSSSAIRERCREGQSVAGMVPAAVADYIEKEGLYTSSR